MASETFQQRTAVEAEIMKQWSSVSSSPLARTKIFFDAAGGAQKRPPSSRGLIGLAEENGCRVIPSSEYATAAGWEQFRRWIGDDSESMALAAAPTMERTWKAASGESGGRANDESGTGDT